MIYNLISQELQKLVIRPQKSGQILLSYFFFILLPIMYMAIVPKYREANFSNELKLLT